MGRGSVRSTLVALVCCLVVATLSLLGGPPSSSAADGPTLRTSPTTYVGGQAISFRGSLGVEGRRRLHLEFHMGRPGDRWTDVDGFTAWSGRSGRYRFTYPAPAMFNISYRVAASGVATPPVTFRARSQEALVTFHRVAKDAVTPIGASIGEIASGRPFGVRVDTAPRVKGRSDLPPPVFAGRGVSLQERVDGSSWQTVDTSRTDPSGIATFAVRDHAPGRVVYRARLDDWTAGGSQVGWLASFPTTLRVTGTTPRPTSVSRSVAVAPGPATSTRLPAPRRTARGSTNASARFGWGAPLFDFTWEHGESLTSPPGKGTQRAGGWLDTSTGTGRASHYNGGLALTSKFSTAGGGGDRGTTAATLQGNAQAYGRWEFRMRSSSVETRTRDFRIVMELVPEDPDAEHCGAQAITVADVAVHSNVMRLGATSLSGKRWDGTVNGIRRGREEPHNFAVEVAHDHITWFYDGAVLATVDDPDAVSGVALTPRLTLRGRGQKEMNRTRAIYDWQRAWPVTAGTQTTSGPPLADEAFSPAC